MSSLKKAASYISPSNYLLDKMGVSDSNFGRQLNIGNNLLSKATKGWQKDGTAGLIKAGSSNTLARPLGKQFSPSAKAAENIGNAYEKGGSGGAWDAIKSGDLTDPSGHLHNVGGIDIPDPGAAPTQDAVVAGSRARDRIRRLAYRAQGRASTIKVSPSAAGYTGQTKQLLGS